MAFWILSFGIEASLAFWTAVARVGLWSVSPPPSRAATVIARASLLKSLPRFASAAPFLCLIECHLECPDIACHSMSQPMSTMTRTQRAGRGVAAGFVFVAMLVAAFSLWTAIPLSWVYIASKLSETQFPSGGPYAVVAVGIVTSILFVAWLIGRLNNLYIRITGTNRLAPMRPSWLKSMRDTSPVANSVTVVEAVLMTSVMLAALALALWFFLLAGSPLPDQ